jgi:hypothetical protein
MFEGLSKKLQQSAFINQFRQLRIAGQLALGMQHMELRTIPSQNCRLAGLRIDMPIDIKVGVGYDGRPARGVRTPFNQSCEQLRLMLNLTL